MFLIKEFQNKKICKINITFFLIQKSILKILIIVTYRYLEIN